MSRSLSPLFVSPPRHRRTTPASCCAAPSSRSPCTSAVLRCAPAALSCPALHAGIRCKLQLLNKSLSLSLSLRENLVNRNLELNLEDKRRAENQICFPKADFLSSLVQMHFQEFNRGYPAGYLPRKNQAFSLLSGSRGDGDGERQASQPAWVPSESSCSQAARPPSARGASLVLASGAGFSVVLLL